MKKFIQHKKNQRAEHNVEYELACKYYDKKSISPITAEMSRTIVSLLIMPLRSAYKGGR